MDNGIPVLAKEGKTHMLLCCGKNSYLLVAGELTCKLSQIPSELLDHVIDRSSDLYKKSIASKASMITEAFNPLKTKKALLSLANDIYSYSNDPIIVFLLLELPLSMFLASSKFSGYKLSSRDSVYERLRYKNRFFGDVIDNLKNKYGIPNQKPAVDEKTFYTEVWSYFLSEEFYTADSYYDLKIIDGCITHLEKICQNAKTIRSLQPKLTALEQKRSCERFSINNFPQWLLPGLNDIRDNSSFVSILGCICLEQLIVSEGNIFIKKCGLCGKVFTTPDVKTCYCSNPNPAYSLKTCKDAMRSKNSKKNLPLFTKYDPARKAYLKWKQENIDSIKETVYKKDNELGKQMIEEIKAIYNDWHTIAEKALYDQNNGAIDEDRALQAFKLPSIEARGPKYYHYFRSKS